MGSVTQDVNVDIMVSLSRLDKRILLQLLEDCTQTTSVMASKVGTTRQTVSNKMRHFLDSGIVRNFSARINPETLSLGLRAFILLREEPKSESRSRNEELLRRIPQISGIYYVFGGHDVVLEVFVESNEELKGLVKEIHALDGIRETQTMIVHGIVKDEREDPLIHVLKK